MCPSACQSFSSMHCTLTGCVCLSSGPGNVLEFDLYWPHCQRFSHEEVCRFIVALMEPIYLFSSSVRSQVWFSQTWVRPLRQIYHSVYVWRVREHWFSIQLSCTLVERQILPTSSRHKYRTAQTGVFPWLSWWPSCIFVRICWEGFPPAAHHIHYICLVLQLSQMNASWLGWILDRDKVLLFRRYLGQWNWRLEQTVQ